MQNNEIKFDINDMNEVKIKNYPQYGSQYGRLVIDSINVDLPLYFGDTLAILKKELVIQVEVISHGEGGSILMCRT